MAGNRLLTVDDDPRISRLVRRVAEKIGFEPLEVNDSSEFEDTYRQFAPNVILLDLNMPGIDGIELLRFLAGAKSRAAVFVISGEDSRVIHTTTRLGRELGLNMAGELHKPVEVVALRTQLAKYCGDDG